MKLICLGVNGPYPGPEGATSGYLVTHGATRLQMDMGTGVLAALTKYTGPEELTAVLVSHWHYDHCCDLLPLIYRLESLHVPPLAVYGPVDEGSLVRKALQGSSAFQLHDLHPGDSLTLGDIQVQVGLARHPAPGVMLRLHAEGRSLCYTGDTNEVPGMADFASGCQLLLADGLFSQDMWSREKPHLSARMAAELARDAGAERVIITHLNPGIDPVSLLAEARSIRPDAVLAERFAAYTV